MMKNKILHVLSILTGLLFINGELNKFFEYMPVPDNLPAELVKDNAALVEISWLIPLIAVAEIVGGILLLLSKTRALGVLVLFPVCVGILLVHIFVDTTGLPIALVIWAILIWLIIDNYNKYKPLIE